MDPQAPSGNSMSLLEKWRAAVQHCPHSSPHCHLLAPCRHCSLSQSPPKNGETTAMGHSEPYAELDTWILGLSSATETFREIEPVHSLSRGDPLSPRFWEFLLAIFSSLHTKPFLLCSVCYNAPLWGFSSFMVMVPTMCGLPPRVH